MEIIQDAATCLVTADGSTSAGCTAAIADKSTCEAAESAGCTWKGIGDAYAGAYTEVSFNDAGVNFGAMAVVTGTNLVGTAITWGTANPAVA